MGNKNKTFIAAVTLAVATAMPLKAQKDVACIDIDTAAIVTATTVDDDAVDAVESDSASVYTISPATVITDRDDKKVWRDLVAFGSGSLFGAGVTELMKHSIHERRPNGGKYSFPSRHASWSARLTSGLAVRLYEKSPWWVIGTHALNCGVGTQRVFAEKHYPKDVLGGYAIGFASTAVGQAIGYWIFPAPATADGPVPENEWMPQLSIVSRAVFPVGRIQGHVSFRTSLSSSLELMVPVGDRLGLLGAFDLTAMPYYLEDRYLDMLKSCGLSLGVAGYEQISERWSLNADIRAGVARNFNSANWHDKNWSLTVGVNCGAEYSITRKLKLGGYAGYGYRTFSSGISLWNVGFSTIALF